MSIPLSNHLSPSSLQTLKFPPSPPHAHELPSLTKAYNPCNYSLGPRVCQAEITSFYSPANSLYEPDGISTIASTPSMSGIQRINGSSNQPTSASHLSPPHHPTRAPLCPQCKGHKYGFTPYFHNTEIFPEPPHELLSLVEQSYLLRNRLKSLFINYVTRTFDHDRLDVITSEIVEWRSRVECLAREVLISSMGFELNTDGLEAVKTWAAELVERLSNHVSGVERMRLRNEEQKELLIEFKKLWEVVWTGYLADRVNRRRSGRASGRALRSTEAAETDLPASEL
ncbi:hypothetical protein MFRU_004g01430 [Monilinia fructicola]|uniref:Uncharacterized protein n=1 Tax=Monilinia fructicola TaxID=38448 RepID=A0A5M9JLR5_MONFR|nr:hypothetical protein EYC84_000976 [Monilinia fructicola]KAG4033639.1 hypothetical protein MFRU_004g01430 [Monilinia fructicola]